MCAPEIEPVESSIDDLFDVDLQAAQACPRYLCRVVRGIDPHAATPDWMVEKLRRSDIRAISPVVDVTNYVLLELGQPMHAFDLDKLSGGIVVRTAEAGEEIELLNDETVRLRDDNLVIADYDGPVALAGIMGGAENAVTLITAEGEEAWPRMDKAEVAVRLARRIAGALA